MLCNGSFRQPAANRSPQRHLLGIPGNWLRLLAGLVFYFCGGAAAVWAQQPLVAPEPVPDFVRDVEPLLARHCYDCHGPDLQESDLRLDIPALALRGGNRGPALVPGKPEKSLLLQVVEGKHELTMPPEGERLTAQEIAVLRRWVAAGAKAPERPVPRRRSDHWAFQPVRRPELPLVRNPSWCRNPIDRFVLARLEAAGMQPSPPANRYTLIRRVYLDLLGLLPSPEEVDRFVSDPRPDAYQRLVDRLLASPHYGERWARHWLDVARYADSNGYTIDGPRQIWKYRDWVIQALNRNMPFDQFIIEQLAGDLLPQPTTDQLVATGFHRNTLINQEGGTDPEQFRVEAVADRVNTTGAVLLGLTLECARCHDHKYDPISQREYYQLFAFFNDCDEPTLELPTPEQARKKKRLQQEIAACRRQIEQLRRKLPAAKGKLPLVAPGAEHAAIAARLKRKQQQLKKLQGELRSLQGKIVTTMILRRRAQPRKTFIHVRGDFLRPGAPVEPGVPEVLPPLPPQPGKQLTRLDLARWLVSPRNPLTSRVTVNRIWQRYFGLGLVETENDFGTRGAPPSHPKLLDWLAADFVASGWDLKRLHRLILTSATYRQQSRVLPASQQRDPRNRLLSRAPRLRLEAEVIRDTALCAAGVLSRKIGGPGVYPPQPKEVYRFTQVKKPWPESQGEDRYRRGMYIYFWRSSPYPFLITFDAPRANVTCTRRVRSNTPLQALALANDQQFVELAQHFALRVLRQSGSQDLDRLRRAFRLALVRPPDRVELELLARHLRRQRDYYAQRPEEAQALTLAALARKQKVPLPEFAAWSSVCRVLLNLDEFVTRE